MPRRAALLSLALAALTSAGVARAADPIMPLSDVVPGMQCIGKSVVQGVAISSFDVDVIDVLADNGGEGPRILIRVSGPAVDQTGIGPGFSGSPIYCPMPDGTMANAGAISEGIGAYGNNVVLATPIQQMLDEPVTPPVRAIRDAPLLRAAHPLAEPLSISGLSSPLMSAIQRAAATIGRVVYAAPAAPRGVAAFPVQPLVPGASVAVGYSSGAVAAGAIGTVTYVNGNDVWAFGHDLAGAGRRSLFLQDAYVYTIINNPLGTSDTSTYKLAAPGHDVGTLSDDAPDAVVGTVGALPPHFPLHVVATDLDAHTSTTLDSQVADESALGLPEGQSGLSLVGPAAVAEAAFEILHGSPASQSGTLCFQVHVAQMRRPLGFCNDYVGGSPGDNGIAASPQVADVAQAIGDLDAFDARALTITGVDITLTLRRELGQAYMTSARVPPVVHRGQRLKVRIALRAPRGRASSLTVVVRVPRNEKRGHRQLVLIGTPADVVGPAPSSNDITVDLGLSGSGDGSQAGPATVGELADEIASIHRFTGLNAVFRSRNAEHGALGPQVFNDPQLRLTGVLGVPVVVR